MEEKPKPERKLNLVPFEWDLEPISESPKGRNGSFGMKPAAVMIEPTGRATLNRAATNLVRDLVRASQFAERPFAILPAVTPDLASIGLYLVNPGTAGSVVPKPVDRNRRFSLDLSGMLTQHPDLRSSMRRECPITASSDKNKKPVLTAPIKGTPAWTKVRRPAASQS